MIERIHRFFESTKDRIHYNFSQQGEVIEKYMYKNPHFERNF
jgi:hypothetical protein